MSGMNKKTLEKEILSKPYPDNGLLNTIIAETQESGWYLWASGRAEPIRIATHLKTEEQAMTKSTAVAGIFSIPAVAATRLPGASALHLILAEPGTVAAGVKFLNKLLTVNPEIFLQNPTFAQNICSVITDPREAASEWAGQSVLTYLENRAGEEGRKTLERLVAASPTIIRRAMFEKGRDNPAHMAIFKTFSLDEFKQKICPKLPEDNRAYETYLSQRAEHLRTSAPAKKTGFFSFLSSSKSRDQSELAEIQQEIRDLNPAHAVTGEATGTELRPLARQTSSSSNQSSSFVIVSPSDADRAGSSAAGPGNSSHP